MYVCTYMYKYINICMHIYIYMYAYMYRCICVYIRNVVFHALPDYCISCIYASVYMKLWERISRNDFDHFAK